MPVAYDPSDFLSVVTATKGSALPRVIVRSAAVALLTIPAQLPFFLHHVDHDVSNVLVPFSVLISLLTSFRINEAFSKWNRAAGLHLAIHASIRDAMAKVQGFPDYRYVTIQHPISSLNKEQIRERAEKALPEVLSILGLEQ